MRVRTNPTRVTAKALLLVSASLALHAVVKSAAAHELHVPMAEKPSTLLTTPKETSTSDAGEKRDRMILAYKTRLAQRPDDLDAMGRLGMAELDQARSIEDPRFYTRAESLFSAVLAHDPKDFTALLGMGSLTVSRHDFKGALSWGQRGLDNFAESAPFLGVLVDANVELGRYDDATSALDRMLAVKPDLTAYSRASYLYELRGDYEQAIRAMNLAANAGQAGSEEAAWCRVHIGDLEWKTGRLDEAERDYRAADHDLPGYPRALGGLARLAAARGDFETAALLYESTVDAFPSAQYRTELGDVYAALGRHEEADLQYHLVRDAAEEAREHGMNVDLEMALFEVDHGADPAAMVIVAEDAYDRRPSTQAAHVYGWTLYKAGRIDEARVAIDSALHLGAKDPEWLYHAGVIYHAAGDESSALRCLEAALAMNPRFSLRAADEAQALLRELKEKKS